MEPMVKYPRTRHIEGSRLQPGDEDLSQVPFADLAGKHLVVEEKLDGANMGVSFNTKGALQLQSRGHFLTGGSANEQQFEVLKSWANTYSWVLHDILGTRYIMYGEGLFKKHSVFYDALPHYFMEFDVYDREEDCFLSTDLRRVLFDGSPVVSVPVLFEGKLTSLGQLTSLIKPSLYKTGTWRRAFEEEVLFRNLDLERAWRTCENSDLAEGLYIKWEEGGRIVRWVEELPATAERAQGEALTGIPLKTTVCEGRYKWVRHNFHQQILVANETANGHVAFQPMIPNRLAAGVDLFAWSGS